MKKDIEKALLSSMISKQETIFEAGDILTINDFNWSENARVFEALMELKKQNTDITPITLSEKTNNFTLSSELFAGANGLSSTRRYAEKVLEESKIRKIKNLSLILSETNGTSEEIAGLAMKELMEITKNTTEDTSIKGAIRALEKMQEENIKHLESGNEYIGIPTGIESIDKITDGMQKNMLWLVNAYTSVGKTFFALNAITNALKQNKRVCLIALEMGRENLVARLIGIDGELNSLGIVKGYHINDEKELDAKEKLWNSGLEIVKRKRKLSEIVQAMYAEHYKAPVDLFVIDYLQHIKADGKSRYDVYSDASNEFQDFAERNGVPVLLLSQVDNASVKSGQTDVISTKGSGDVPADADVAILLQFDKERQQAYPDHIKAINCIVQKQRNGMTGKLDLIMNTKNGRFDDATNYGNHK